MIGPALGIAAITSLSPTLTLSALGALFGGTALLIWLINPPIRESVEPGASTTRPPLRSWLTGRLVATLLVAAGTLFCSSAPSWRRWRRCARTATSAGPGWSSR